MSFVCRFVNFLGGYFIFRCIVNFIFGRPDAPLTNFTTSQDVEHQKQLSEIQNYIGDLDNMIDELENRFDELSDLIDAYDERSLEYERLYSEIMSLYDELVKLEDKRQHYSDLEFRMLFNDDF